MEDLDLTQVCRICLMEHKDVEMAAEDVVNKLLDCASVQLPPGSLICAFCKTEVDKWYLFKQQVIRSTEVVRYIEENRIKKEEESTNQSNVALIEERYIKIERPETVEVKQEINVDDTFQEEETHTFQEEMHTFQEEETHTFQEEETHTFQEEEMHTFQEEEVHTFQEEMLTFQECCNICGEIFSSLLELSIHKQTHPTTEPPEYQCDLCHKTFQSKTGFIWHTKMHTALKLNVSSERFSCPCCPMIYEKEDSLVDHLRWKHNHVVKKTKKQPQIDTLQCPVCKKKFDSIRGLNAHKNLKSHNDHTSAKPPKRVRRRPKKKRWI